MGLRCRLAPAYARISGYPDVVQRSWNVPKLQIKIPALPSKVDGENSITPKLLKVLFVSFVVEDKKAVKHMALRSFCDFYVAFPFRLLEC